MRSALSFLDMVLILEQPVILSSNRLPFRVVFLYQTFDLPQQRMIKNQITPPTRPLKPCYLYLLVSALCESWNPRSRRSTLCSSSIRHRERQKGLCLGLRRLNSFFNVCEGKRHYCKKTTRTLALVSGNNKQLDLLSYTMGW